MIVETEAVVLHAMNYRDTSKIVTLYSRKFGKIKVIAKGTRNQKTNKFGSSLEPMTLSSVVLYKKEHRDLHLLSKSEIVTPLSRLQDDSERMFTGLSLIELVNMVMHDEEENELIFLLLAESLKQIDTAPKNVVNVLIAFMVKLFQQFGFGLSVDECVQCGRRTEKENFSSAFLRLSDGKYICSDCSKEGLVSGTRISGEVLKMLHYMQMHGIEQSAILDIPIKNCVEILATSQAYLRYHIEGTRTLKSLSLLYSTK
ncbi:MAG: DNA repair protein RecO [Bacteroidota bacterium]|nr:DNA repair protein RecO [Bacteroidota bacterium]